MLCRKLQDLTYCISYNINFLNDKAHGAKQFRKKYTILEELGRGGFGIVYKGERNEDGAPVAVKFIEHKRVREWTMKCKQLIPSEICLLEMCRNVSGVVQLIDCSKGFLIVMERPEQCLDLFDLISVYGYLDEDIARSIFVQILNTTCLLYSIYGIFHRDIKDENIIINMHTGEAVLVDFGAAVFISEACIKEFQGTRSYCPPEWFKRLTYMPSEATVWSLGIVLYVMVSGCLPFQNEVQICLGRFTIPKHISKDCENLLRQCLAVTPSRRPDLLEIFKHRWLNQPTVVHSEPFKVVLQQSFQRRKEAQAANKPLPSHSNSAISSDSLKKHRHHSSYDNVVMNIRTDKFALRDFQDTDNNVLIRPRSIMEESEHSDSLFCSACETFSMISTDPQNSELYFTPLEDIKECCFRRSKEAIGSENPNEDSSTQTFSSCDGTVENCRKEEVLQTNSPDRPIWSNPEKVMNSRLVMKHWLQNVAATPKYDSLKFQKPLTCQQREVPQKQPNVNNNFLKIFNIEPQHLATPSITTIVSK
ncbi:unnamed protein product [Onchocerca ochengi]|uniref:Serine/threonine-protein kinase 1 n=1 Tax=Onchocerca ochengi TaxID=42157 RepID=A0A182DYU7_ONCOC|nr:unnamed protein product [Onchocerca ochengi]